MINRLKKQELVKERIELRKWQINFWKHAARSRHWKKIIELRWGKPEEKEDNQ